MTGKQRRALTDRLRELLDTLTELLSPRQPSPASVPVATRKSDRDLRR